MPSVSICPLCQYALCANMTEPITKLWIHIFSAVALTAVTLLATASLYAADPALSYVTPHGAQRGTEVDVVLQGARLSDAQELLLYEPGIEVREIRGDGDKAHAKLVIAADCRLGIQALRVRTATGISSLRTFLSVRSRKYLKPNRTATSRNRSRSIST